MVLLCLSEYIQIHQGENLRVSDDDNDDWSLVVSNSIQHHLREEVHSRRRKDEEGNDG